MAVLLCRGDGKPYPTPPPPEMRGLPRIVVDYEPIPDHQDYKGKAIKARTASQLTYSDRTREEHWREIHHRHSVQLTQCGFNTPNYKPYKDMGRVELDDAKLILDNLGQTMENKTPARHVKLLTPDVRGPKPPSMASPYQIKMHSKTPSQFPTDLLTLDKRIDEGQTQLEHMRRGRRLFSLLEREKRQKQRAEEERRQSNQANLMSRWREAEIVSDDDLFNGEPEPPDMEERKRRMSVVKDMEYCRLGVDTPKVERKRRMSIAKEMDYCYLGVDTPRVEVTPDEEGVDIESAGGVTSKWYRQLCVMVWILEAMQLDSAHFAVPLAKCWNLDCKYTDEVGRKRIYERDQKSLKKWQELNLKVKAERNVSPSRQFKSKVAAFIAFRSPSMVGKKSTSVISTAKDSDTATSSSRSKIRATMTRMEEEKMRKQKKLTPTQMENLVQMLDEELNYTQKQSRTRINALLKEGQAKQEKQTRSKPAAQTKPAVTMDLDKMKMQFSDADEERRMIVHEQLTAMERDREEAICQRLGSLKVSGNLWSDLAAMRRGVQIESTEMARRKLLMNYKWYEELVSSLPTHITSDRYCGQLLDSLKSLASYMYSVGPRKMSKSHLIQVLATLTPWELYSPDVDSAIKYIIEHVVYIAEEDYSKWLEQHVAVYRYTHPRDSGKKPPDQSSSRISNKESVGISRSQYEQSSINPSQSPRSLRTDPSSQSRSVRIRSGQSPHSFRLDRESNSEAVSFNTRSSMQ